MTSPTNWTRPRRFAGSIATTLASALTDASATSVWMLWAAPCNPTASAIASLVEQQRGHGGAGRQLVAAVDTATRLDGIAELAEPVDVAAQGAM